METRNKRGYCCRMNRPAPAAGCEKAPTSDASRGCNYPSLAMVYADYQEFGELFDPEKALITGTLFADLDKPCYACLSRGCSR